MIADPAALDCALAYAARGWAVLALWWGEDGICACPRGVECESPGKHPIAYIGRRAICPNGVKDATLDPERITQWWARVPDANVGIATGAASGLVALDSDPRNGGDESLVMLENSLPDGLPDTPRSVTGSGGEHLLFRAPAGRVGNFKGKDWGFPGLDVKGDGGYIVAPPSLHVSGRRYQWDGGAHPDDLALAPLPAALARRLSGGAQSNVNGTSSALVPTVVTAGGTDIAAVLAGVPEGERGVSLFRLAAKLRRVDVPYAVARELVLQAAAAASPPYQPAAALKHLDSAYSRYEPSEGRASEIQGAEEEAPRSRFKLWTLEELEQRQPPTWLVDGFLVQGTLAMMEGREGTMKTFAALDLSLHVASKERDWHGRATEHGMVVYVSAEGSTGMAKRAAAWRKHHGVTAVPRFLVLPEPVQLMDDKDVDELLAVLLTMPEKPALVVIDTLARCFVGGNENDAKDMGLFVAACERLIRVTGATVLIIHHVGRHTGESRGSGALLGGVYSRLQVVRDEVGVVLTVLKQKDFDQDEKASFTPEIIDLPDGESSVVLVPQRLTVDSMKRAQRMVYDVLSDRFEGTAPSDRAWLAAAVAAGASRPTYYRAKKALLKTGMVREDQGQFTDTKYEQVSQADAQVSRINEVSNGLTRPHRGEVSSITPLRRGDTDTSGDTNGDEALSAGCPECGSTLQDGACYACGTRFCLQCGSATRSPFQSTCVVCANQEG